MKLLALDTSTEACSAALLCEGEILHQYQIAPRQHASLILPMIEKLLSESQLTLTQLDAIAFGRGPGAFVGVRIAAAVTQGIAFSVDLPVVPVSTLAALAQGTEQDFVLTAIDARMGEVYWGAYARDGSGLVSALIDETVVSPQYVPVPVFEGKTWFGAGTGWLSYSKIFQQQIQFVSDWRGEQYPNAACVAQLGAHEFLRGIQVDAANAIPTYLRNQVTQSSRKNIN